MTPDFWQPASPPANLISKTEVNRMKLKYLWPVVLTLAFSFTAFAQQDNGGIKQDTKDAAHATGRAAKKTGRKIKHGTKKVIHKGAHATSKAAGKVEDKTQTPPK